MQQRHDRVRDIERVPVNPKILRWAHERSGIPYEELVAKNFKKLLEWERGEAQPTLRQAEAFARKVCVPFGYLFLSEPPEEELPVRDFRVLDGQEVTRPSANLLDTVYACQGRQDWYRDFALEVGQLELDSGMMGRNGLSFGLPVIRGEIRLVQII